MGDIIKINPAKSPDAPDISQAVIDALDHMMGEARAGRITSLALAGVSPAGSAYTIVTDTDNSPGLIGAVALLQHRILMSVESGEDNDVY